MSDTLLDDLRSLGLGHTAETLDDLIAQASKSRLGPRELLERIAASEKKERARRSLERRLARSRIGRFKPMADFDWAWPKSIPREAVGAALELEFLAEAKNVILVASQGLGKTMIAQNIAHQALLKGQSVIFTTAAQLLLDLGAQESARSLEQRLRHYCNRTSLLIVDEVGYLSYDARNADLLFQVVSRRYERKSIVMTTNLTFSEWPEVFPNAACTTAMIDRLVHHAEIISIKGDSYRRRTAMEEAKPATKAARAKKSPAGSDSRAS